MRSSVTAMNMQYLTILSAIVMKSYLEISRENHHNHGLNSLSFTFDQLS